MIGAKNDEINGEDNLINKASTATINLVNFQTEFGHRNVNNLVLNDLRSARMRFEKLLKQN